MQTENNSIDLSFRSYDENTRDTDLNVNINAENVDEVKLMRTLNTWLRAIDSGLVVKDTRNA